MIAVVLREPVRIERIERIERIGFVTVRSFQLAPRTVKELIRSGLFVVGFLFRTLWRKHISSVVGAVVLRKPGRSYLAPRTVQELEVIRTVLFAWQGLSAKHISSVEGAARLW